MVSFTRRKARSGPVWLEAQAPLAQWYATGLGQSIAERLQTELGSRLGDVFGYQGLQVGNLVPGVHLLAGAGLQRLLVVDAPEVRIDAIAPDLNTDKTDKIRPRADIHGDVLALPVASGTMKAVVFFHTLDFCDHPHQALREANRVLTDDGQLIIVGFNPYSAFGARHALTAWRRREPWNGRFYARHRVTDWLSVLDYRVLDSTAMFIRPPINSERVLKRLARLEKLHRWLSGVGAVYIMRARKQTVPMTMIRQWAGRTRTSLSAASLARTGERSRTRPRATVARIDSRSR